MKHIQCSIFCACVSSALLLASGSASAQLPLAQPLPASTWQVVVNNADLVPNDPGNRKFNSYNQPSVNAKGLVVFRGRSKAGESGTGEPAHGIFLRDMSITNSPVTTLFDRNTLVPQPNSVGAMFTEPPSFPRIDLNSNTVASRGSHQPVWEYETGIDPSTGLPLTTRAGTTGIYTNPFGPLISGANNLGAAPGFGFFGVPGLRDGSGNPLKFDVFPGAPAVADARTIAFKGNYSVPDPQKAGAIISKTGVYYRRLVNESIYNGSVLEPAGGSGPVIRIADTDTVIPGYEKENPAPTFGSTAPPSAVNNQAVFSGFDNEDTPTKGGIYLAALDKPTPLTTLISIGGQVPGEVAGVTFTKLGEGLSFDGRFVAFWGAWGTETTSLVLQCPIDGNANVKAYCQSLYGPEGTLSQGGFHTSVPVHQGIFVHDVKSHVTWSVAKTTTDYNDFVYWNFSGKVPPPQGGAGGTGGDGGSGGDGTIVTAADGGSGGGDGGKEGETDGEPARWRSASFVAVSGLVDGKVAKFNLYAAFKARKGPVENGAYVNPTDGIYLWQGPVNPVRSKLVETGMDGTMFDPEAIYIPEEEGVTSAATVNLPVTAMGIERDGLRGKTLVLNISMGNEDAGWAGIYLTKVAK